MDRPIVVVGSLNMDLVVKVPRHPAGGQTVLGGDYAAYPGGCLRLQWELITPNKMSCYAVVLTSKASLMSFC